MGKPLVLLGVAAINTSNSFVKLINNKFIYDGSSGQYFFVGKTIIEAVRQMLKLPWEEQIISDENLLYDAKEIVNQRISEGCFKSVPFKGYSIPSDDEISSPKFKVLTLIVTEQCNLRCTYCPYSNETDTYRKHSSAQMSLDVADKAVDYFISRASNDSAIGFYGGEPFLNFELIKHVVYRVRKELPDLNINFTVTTNLNYFSDEIARFLYENKVFMVVSLDGPQEIHDKCRKNINGGGSFSTLTENLNYIIRNYPDYFSNYVTSNTVIKSHADMDAIEHFFSNLTHRFGYSTFSSMIQVNPKILSDNGTTYDEEAVKIRNWIFEKICSPSVYGKLREHVLLSGLIHKKIKSLEEPQVHDEKGLIPFKTCIPGNKILVNVDGSLSICDKCESLKIGHISTGINFNKTRQLISSWIELLGDNCSNCWAVGFCRTCYISAWNGKEFDANLLKSHCKSFRTGTLKWLEVYLPLKYQNKNIFDCLQELEEKA